MVIVIVSDIQGDGHGNKDNMLHDGMNRRDGSKAMCLCLFMSGQSSGTRRACTNKEFRNQNKHVKVMDNLDVGQGGGQRWEGLGENIVVQRSGS